MDAEKKDLKKENTSLRNKIQELEQSPAARQRAGRGHVSISLILNLLLTERPEHRDAGVFGMMERLFRR